MAAYQNHQDELAQLQELSNKWEPEATVLQGPQLCPDRARTDWRQGPLVSERLSSSAIATEYANADPVYQAKTAV
jgi:ubiquitin thioesterase protein OTUB1